MEILKIIVGLPKWLLLAPFRLLIACLNMFGCPWVVVCSEKSFLLRHDQGMYTSISYMVKCDDSIRFGHFLVALPRGAVHKKNLYQIEETFVASEQSHVVKNSAIKRVIEKNVLQTIIDDCKFLSQ